MTTNQFALADTRSSTATFSASGSSVAAPFTQDKPLASEFTSGTGFVGHHDLLIGAVELGASPTPFVAVRTQATTLAAATGTLAQRCFSAAMTTTLAGSGSVQACIAYDGGLMIVMGVAGSLQDGLLQFLPN